MAVRITGQPVNCCIKCKKATVVSASLPGTTTTTITFDRLVKLVDFFITDPGVFTPNTNTLTSPARGTIAKTFNIVYPFLLGDGQLNFVVESPKGGCRYSFFYIVDTISPSPPCIDCPGPH